MRTPALLVLAFLLVPALRADEPPAAIVLSPPTDRLREERGLMPDFSFTDQLGRTVTREDLRGKVWVAYFFFTTCTAGCAQTTLNVAELHRKFAGWSDVAFVGLNVFPEQDTPGKLRAWSRQFQPDDDRWLFLTGPFADVEKLNSAPAFKLNLVRDLKADRGKEVDHTFLFFLVDHRGVIRGYASGLDREELARLETRIGQLVQAKYFPAINASLNAAAGLLLVAGWIAVRRRRIALHKTCMLLALAVSAVFLGCYLYYHFLVLDGQPTRFPETGAPKIAYLAVLLSHTVLAVAVAPLALISAWLGLKGRIDRHRKLARWTAPLWLYVSLTGVVVYLMLYHWYAPA